MDGIISIRIFGRKSSSFFDRRLSIGSLRVIFSGLGAIVLLSLIVLTLYTTRALQPLEESMARSERISMTVRDLAAERWQIAQYLATGDDFSAAEQAALNIQALIANLALFIDDYSILNQLEETGTAYLNLLRSYHSLTSAPEAGETRALLRDQLDITANALAEGTDAVLLRSITTTRVSIHPLSVHMLHLAALIFLILGAVFAVGFALVTLITRHSARILRDIREVTCQITEGNFNVRLNLTDEADRDLVQLALAFNRMADKLNLALQSEVAATEQNHLQLLKLARQERMTAILEERQRIARELHDSVKQQLFSITLSAGAVINLLQDAPALVKTYLEHIKQAGHSAQSEMTILLQELVSVPLQDKRLEDALLDYLNPLCQTHGLKLLWRTDGTNTLTIAQEHALFRAIQEAVSNVIRHSDATVLRVSIRYGLLTHVIVEDNGKGFVTDEISPTSNGLSMMRTRLKRVGGHLKVDAAPGTGTRLTIQLDLRRR